MGKLFSPGGSKDNKIDIYANTLYCRRLRGKHFRQKLFFVEFYIRKKVSCKIFV